MVDFSYFAFDSPSVQIEAMSACNLLIISVWAALCNISILRSLHLSTHLTLHNTNETHKYINCKLI